MKLLNIEQSSTLITSTDDDAFLRSNIYGNYDLSNPRYRALLIGIDNYSDLPDLRGCASDLRAFSSIFSGYKSDDRIKFLLNERADRPTIMQTIREMVARSENDDDFHLILCGHTSNQMDLEEASADVFLPFESRFMMAMWKAPFYLGKLLTCCRQQTRDASSLWWHSGPE